MGKMVSDLIHSNTQAFCQRMNRRANAWAAVRGGKEYPNLLGCVKFFQTPAGVLISAEMWGLPKTETGVFGLHIHNGQSCGPGKDEKEFGAAGSHFNPENLPHPEHAGDLPPLFSQNGYAWASFLAARFAVREILGRTVIVHAKPDDFTTQPSGNAGEMIACGVIR